MGFMGVYEYLWAYMGIYGFRVSMGIYRCIWVFMGVYGYL